MNFNEIKNILERHTFQYSHNISSFKSDGRLESAALEQEVIILLKKIFANTDVIVSNASKIRDWYDVKFETEEKFYPINIKITQGKNADNVGSKEGLFFALTGLNPDTDKYKKIKRNWKTYNEQLLANFKNNNEDYYFIIIFKDSGKIFFTSLKRINKLQSNGNNLPFQCKWQDNLNYTTRNQKEQANYLLNTFIDSFIKKANGLEVLLNWRDKNN